MPDWPEVGSLPPQGTRFAVPILNRADFLSILETSDGQRDEDEWQSWQENIDEWRRLLSGAGYRIVEVSITARGYRRFLDEDETVADTELSLWDYAARVAERGTDHIVLSLDYLSLIAWNLDQFPCVGGAAVEDPTARISVDLPSKKVHLSILMLDPEKPADEWAFQSAGTLDFSETPELLQQLATGETPWFGGLVYRDGQDWGVDFGVADTEAQLLATLDLASARRVLEYLAR